MRSYIMAAYVWKSQASPIALHADKKKKKKEEKEEEKEKEGGGRRKRRKNQRKRKFAVRLCLLEMSGTLHP